MSTTQITMHLGEEVDSALIQQESKTLAGMLKIKNINLTPSHVVDPPEEKWRTHPMQLRRKTVNTVEINLIDFSESGDDNNHQHKAVKLHRHICVNTCKILLYICVTYFY